MNRPPGPRTTSQELAAQVPTIPLPITPALTDPAELAKREAVAERKAVRSRVAEIVALVTIVSGAITQLATHIPELTALVRALRGDP